MFAEIRGFTELVAQQQQLGLMDDVCCARGRPGYCRCRCCCVGDCPRKQHCLHYLRVDWLARDWAVAGSRAEQRGLRRMLGWVWQVKKDHFVQAYMGYTPYKFQLDAWVRCCRARIRLGRARPLPASLPLPSSRHAGRPGVLALYGRARRPALCSSHCPVGLRRRQRGG
jgi:hypothetical protein